MAIVKRMSSKASVGKIEKYLKDKDKTEEKLISGMNCDSDKFANECKATSLLYNKNQNKDDRKYYHVVQSFSPKDNENLTPEKAHKIATEYAEKNFKGHEVLIVTHTDKDHIHNHYVVNSVSLENGKKYRADNKSLWELRKTSNELCRENGLSNSIQPLEKKAKEKFNDGEFRKEIKGEETWKTILRNQIKDTMKKSKSIEEFQKQLKEKYNVDTQIRIKKSKGKSSEIIEYKPEGNRKFMDGEKRLGTEYGKENIDGVTRANAEKTRREIAGNSGTRTAGFNAGSIESEIRNRQIESVELDLKQREQELARSEEINGRTKEPKPKVNEKVRGSRERTR